MELEQSLDPFSTAWVVQRLVRMPGLHVASLDQKVLLWLTSRYWYSRLNPGKRAEKFQERKKNRKKKFQSRVV